MNQLKAEVNGMVWHTENKKIC